MKKASASREKSSVNLNTAKSKLHKLLKQLYARKLRRKKKKKEEGNNKNECIQKYQQLQKEYKDLDNEKREYERLLKETKIILQQLQNENNTDQSEQSRLEAQKLNYEQQIDNVLSCIRYIQKQLYEVIAPLKSIDPNIYHQLKLEQVHNTANDMKSCEGMKLCHAEDVNCLGIQSLPLSKSLIQYMINEQINLKTMLSEFQKATQHFERTKKQMKEEFDNEIRQKNVLIENLQKTLQLQQQQQQQEQQQGQEQQDETTSTTAHQLRESKTLLSLYCSPNVKKRRSLTNELKPSQDYHPDLTVQTRPQIDLFASILGTTRNGRLNNEENGKATQEDGRTNPLLGVRQENEDEALFHKVTDMDEEEIASKLYYQAARISQMTCFGANKKKKSIVTSDKLLHKQENDYFNKTNKAEISDTCHQSSISIPEENKSGLHFSHIRSDSRSHNSGDEPTSKHGLFSLKEYSSTTHMESTNANYLHMSLNATNGTSHPSSDVFSRLTSPSSWVGSSRTRINDLDIRRQRIAQQREKDRQKQLKIKAGLLTSANSLSPSRPHSSGHATNSAYLQSNTNGHIERPQSALTTTIDNVEYFNENVFQRLHATSIRHQRLNNNFNSNVEANGNSSNGSTFTATMGMPLSSNHSVNNVSFSESRPERASDNDNTGDTFLKAPERFPSTSQSHLSNPVRFLLELSPQLYFLHGLQYNSKIVQEQK
ncbi:hypothetical protein RFI_03339 [Reticulomyxa filosa]|uniref:Uncharacterized protein n=1 Tax=Reticulomyxa filosa TaxID=46433 RepID=X6P6M6_RETFI|nr:hypothetical protein RFI_03339 [Reticulomyxa filosa]|eukprot:ETO33763.1 hypothetical protein RFI_03339 [Reticulomyxa filosa]